MDEFSLAPDPLVSPLDIGQFGGTPPLQPQAPRAPQMPNMGQRGGGMQEAAPLLMLLPLIAKGGGRSAIAAFLRGMQKSRATQMNEQRVTNQDRRADAQQESLDAYRRDQIEQQRLQRQQQFRTQFATGLQGLEDDEAIRAYLDLMGPQGEQLGINRGDLDAFAMRTQKPSTLQKRAAEKRIASLKGQFGQDKWMQEGAKFLHDVGGERVPFEELLRRSGMVPDPQAPTQTPAVEIPGASEYAIVLRGLIDEFSANNKRQPNPSERVQLMQRANQVAGASANPQLAEIQRQIAEMRLQQLQTGTDANPRQVATFNQIASTFDRSPLMRAADRTIVLDDAIKTIEQTPTDPAAQLRLAYSYIQALDTYQSAVREGELQNLGILGTKLEQWSTQLHRVVQTGAFLPPEVAKNIAADAKRLIETIATGRKRKMREFASRARVSGVGPMWDQFVSGLEEPNASGQTQETAPTDPKKSAQDKLNRR